MKPLILVPFLLLSFIPLSSANDGAPFDYFMFTTIYPTAVCRADDDSVPDSCEIPTGTPLWTIHGLWPNYENGSYPQNCKGTPKHFDADMIKSIAGKMRTVWPNLFPGKSIQSFWKHEYEKHGTCAQSDELFDTELLYFTEVMKVYDSIDIATAMSSIGPSDKLITKNDVLTALTSVTGGNTFQFHCLKDKITKQFLLGDIRICLNKDLTIRSCPGPKDNVWNRVSRFERSVGNGGHQPLPSYQPCPAEFVYLPPEKSSSKSSEPKTSLFGFVWNAIKNVGR